MKKLSMVFVAVLIATAMASTTFAYGWSRGQGRGGCNGGPGNDGDITAVSQLGLSADQTVKIKALREAHLKDVKPLQDKMFSKRGELKLLWLQTKPDQEKIMAVQKEIRSLRDTMQDKRTSQRLAMFNVLTPEQQAKAQTFMAGKGFGRGGGRCAGGPGGSGGGPGFGPGGGPRGN